MVVCCAATGQFVSASVTCAMLCTKASLATHIPLLNAHKSMMYWKRGNHMSCWSFKPSAANPHLKLNESSSDPVATCKCIPSPSLRKFDLLLVLPAKVIFAMFGALTSRGSLAATSEVSDTWLRSSLRHQCAQRSTPHRIFHGCCLQSASSLSDRLTGQSSTRVECVDDHTLMPEWLRLVSLRYLIFSGTAAGYELFGHIVMNT